MPKKSKTPRTKKPKGKTVITQKVIVNVSKRGTSKPRGPPQPSQAERLFQLMAQQQQSRPALDASLLRLLQPAQPLQPSLSQLQQLLKPSPPIVIQGLQGIQGPQGPAGEQPMRASTSEIGTQSSPAGDAGLRQFTPSTTEKGTQKSRKQMVETGTDAYPTLSAPIQAEPLPEAIVQPPHALIDTTSQPFTPPPIPESESEEEEKYEEKKKKRPTLKKPDPGEAKAVPTDTQDWMSLFTSAGEIDTSKLQKLPEKRKANTTAPITLREVAKTLGITVPRDKANKADVVELILNYYRSSAKSA